MNKKEKNKSKKVSLKKLVRTATTILLIVCTLFCFVVVASSAVKRDVSIFGYRLFYVVTGSMEPTLPIGSMLVVKSQDTYEVGDIITFYSRDESIKGYPNTHRIVKIFEEYGRTVYITQGDANNIQDTPVYGEDIIGAVRLCFKAGFLTALIEFINSPMGFFAVILLPMLIVTLMCMKDFKRNVQEAMRNSAIKAIESEQKSASEQTAQAEQDNKKECSEYEEQRNDTTE